MSYKLTVLSIIFLLTVSGCKNDKSNAPQNKTEIETDKNIGSWKFSTEIDKMTDVKNSFAYADAVDSDAKIIISCHRRDNMQPLMGVYFKTQDDFGRNNIGLFEFRFDHDKAREGIIKTIDDDIIIADAKFVDLMIYDISTYNTLTIKAFNVFERQRIYQFPIKDGGDALRRLKHDCDL